MGMGMLGNEPNRKTHRKHRIILFFMIFEGICGLQTGSHVTDVHALHSKEAHGYMLKGHVF
jgi:hypothetical protein